MNYYSHYELADVANKILIGNNKKNLAEEDQKDELTWNKSLFIAHLLYKSELELQLNEKKLEEEILQYNISNGTNVKKEVLVANFFIRFVFGEVKIPSLVSGHSIKMYEHEDVREQYKNEALFNELLFLGYLITKYSYEDSRPFVITEYAYQEIYHKFSEIHLQMPSECEMFDLLHFDKINEYLYCYNSFYLSNNVDSQKVVAYLWKIIFNGQSINDIGMKKWLLLTEHFFGFDFIQLLDRDEQDNAVKFFVQKLQAESDLKLDEKNEDKKLLCDMETHRRYETDLFLKNKESVLAINCNDYFLMWCTYNSESRDAFVSNDYRKLYTLPLLSLVYTNQYDKNIQLLINDREKRPYVLFTLLGYIKNKRPGYLIQFIAEKDYGLVFYFTFIDACLDAYFHTSNEIKRDSIKKLLQECVSSFIERKSFAFLSDFQDFSRFLMYIGKYQNTLDRRIDDAILKKNIYKLHIEKLEKLIRKTKHVKLENFVDVFLREKDIILPTCRKIGIEQFTFLFNLLDFANIQENQESIDFIVNSICELYKANVLENKERYISNEYKIMEEYNWGLFYQSLISQKKLNDFDILIHNSFIIPVESKDLSSDEKTYNVDLYKFYLKSLCIAYRQNNRNVENTIIQILNNCFIDDASAKSVDIFVFSYEKSYDGNSSLAIFPLLIEVSNSFSSDNQEKLIKMILKQGNISILFSAYNLIDYEKGRVLIKDYIANHDLTPKIDEIYNFLEFIDIAANVADSRIDEEFEKLLFTRLNEITAARTLKGVVNEFTYRIELLNLFRLYKENDLESLGKYVFPYDDRLGPLAGCKEKIESERLFYLALVHFNIWQQNSTEENSKHLHSSIRCLRDLITKFPDIQKYKCYELYVETFVVSEDVDKKAIDSLINRITQELGNAKEYAEMLLYRKLELYILKKDVNMAYCFFETLDEPLREDFSFAAPIVKCLIDKNMVGHALAIYKNIDSTTCSGDEYKELSSLLPINQIVREYQNTYCQMLCLPDDYRFSVLPGKINLHNADIGTYVLNEIKYALNKILKKIDMVKKITANNLSEDNISDLLEIEINSRLSMLDYKLENQDRSGKSSSGVNAGEIDLEINLNDFSIVIEAVKFSRGSSERKKHIEKTLNYDPSKKYIFDLIYFDVDQDFEASWNTVKTEIDSANYPSGYQKRSTNELPSNNAGVKIAVSNHDGGLVFYHIMANFYYAK